MSPIYRGLLVTVQFCPMGSISFSSVPTSIYLNCLTPLYHTIFMETEMMQPFIRKIHEDELWLYKNPRTSSYVPVSTLWTMVLIAPLIILLIGFLIRRNKSEFGQSILALTLTLTVNGVVTNIMKLSVGRPRPDFFYRCFPDGKADMSVIEDIGSSCTGDFDTIAEGRKSFPSGHSSWSFASLGFLSLWLCGQLGVFSHGRGQSWRILTALSPAFMALMVAVSRTCDYHHHWQDVFAGSSLGMLLAWLFYRQYYPELTSQYSYLSYLTQPRSDKSDASNSDSLGYKTLRELEAGKNQLKLV
ncbi:unnamed protein product, partial [Meganyctiphanes norvegica]